MIHLLMIIAVVLSAAFFFFGFAVWCYEDWAYRRWEKMTDRERLRQIAKWRSTN